MCIRDSNNITLRFDVGVAPSATLIVLHNYEGSNWEIIPDDRVVQNADGTVDVTFDSLSPIAFVVDSTETDTSASTDANAPTLSLIHILHFQNGQHEDDRHQWDFRLFRLA